MARTRCFLAVLTLAAAGAIFAPAASGQQPPPKLILAPPLLNPDDRPAAIPGQLPPQETPAAPQPAAEPEGAFTPSPEFQAWISNLVREQLPDQYEKKKNWGHTTRSLDGLVVKVEDGRLKTHRKYKQANDGKWQAYRIELVDPAEKFDIQVANLRELPDGRVGTQITAVASLKAEGRQALWEHGIQIYSLSAEADARVRLTAETAIAAQLDPTRFPPDVYLRPEVTAAKVDILEFKLRRVSDLHGPVVRSLSHAVREELEAKLAEDNAKLVAKLNKAIDKKEERLKLSAADWVNKFSASASAPAAAESRPAGE